MATEATTPTTRITIRISEADRQAIEAIRVRNGLRDPSSAIRRAIQTEYRLTQEPESTPKKTRKKS